MSRNFLFSLFLVSFYTLSAFSQNYNTLPGVIVTFSNDTLAGVIRERSNYTDGIEFSVSGERKFREYNPADLRYFVLDGKTKYCSIDVQKDSITNKREFLITMVEGVMSLYYCKDNYFIVKKGGANYLISKGQDITRRITEGPQDAVRTIVLEDTRYKGTFKVLTQDCPKVFSKTDNLQYDPKSFTRLVKDYNEIMGPPMQSVSGDDAFKVRIIPGLRGTFLINYMDNFPDDGRYTNDDFNSASCFSAGVVTCIIFSQKFSFQPELLVTQRKSSLYKENGAGLPPEDLNYNIYFLELPLSMYYSMPTKKISPSIFVGPILGYKIADKSDIQTIYSTKIGIGGPEYGIRIGAGLTFRKKGEPFIRLEYFYEKTLTNPYMTHMRYHQLAHNFSACFFIN